MNDINAFLRAIGAIVAVGGGSAAIAYAVFVTRGKQWLENRFARHFEELKHEKAKELEHVRHDITSAELVRFTKKSSPSCLLHGTNFSSSTEPYFESHHHTQNIRT
jgi:hypothetical protein